MLSGQKHSWDSGCAPCQPVTLGLLCGLPPLSLLTCKMGMIIAPSS